MSLSDQHPYALFVAGGLRFPSLAKAQVEVGDNGDAYLASVDIVPFYPEMEFVKNWVQEIWANQAFVSSQMDRVESRLVTLEKVAASFSYFIIEHWVPAQAILIDLHNSTCPLCQRADGMADNGGSASESVQSGWAAPIPVPLPNSRQGEAPLLFSPVPSLISDFSSGSTLLFFFVGARQRLQERSGLSVYINEVLGSMLSFFGSDEREVGSNEGVSEASEGSGYGSGSGVIP